MKWTNKGYEDIICNKNISETTKFCIYGAGKLGGDLYKTLKHYDMFFALLIIIIVFRKKAIKMKQ